MKTKANVNLKLNQLRRQITELDRQIAKLCAKRLTTTAQVFKLKKTDRLPLIDSSRERKVTSTYSKVLAKRSRPQRVKALSRAIIELNPNYPKSK